MTNLHRYCEENAFSDKKTPDWYHTKCFFKNYAPSSISEIAGFNKLNNDDQQRIRGFVEMAGQRDTVTDLETRMDRIKNAKQREQTENEVPCKKLKKEPLQTEQGTSSSFKKEAVAMEDDSAGVSEGKCVKKEPKFEEVHSATNRDLHDEEIMKQRDSLENGEVMETCEPRDKEEVIKEQNDLFHKYRGAVEGLTNLNQILKENGQILTNYSLRKDHLADCMAFGALEPCPKCEGQLILATFYYKCTGVSQWGACTHTSVAPGRRPLVVPRNFLAKPLFEHYSPTVGVRLFRSPPHTKPQPLKNLEFFIYNEEIDVAINDDESVISEQLSDSDDSQDNDDSGDSLFNDDSDVSEHNDESSSLQENHDSGIPQHNDDTNVSMNNYYTNVSVNNDGTNISVITDNLNVSVTNDVTNVSVINEDSNASVNSNDTNVSMNDDKTNVSMKNEDSNVSVNNYNTNVSVNEDDTNVSVKNEDSKASVNNNETNVSVYNDKNISVNNEDANISANNDKTDIQNIASRIMHLGGKVSDSVNPGLAAVVWLGERKQLEDAPKTTLRQIAEMGIEVVHKSFLELIDTRRGTAEDTLRLIRDENIAAWGSDPVLRLGIEHTCTSSSRPREVTLGSVVYTAKGGVVLDPQCPLRDVHVVRDARGVACSAVLSKTDVSTDTNSYYRMQLLQADTHQQYWVFFAWGRIGTDQGNWQLLEFKTVEEAKMKFFGKFEEKTKNRWKNRANFVKHPNCYYLQDLEYTTGTDPVMESSKDAALPPSVQRLVKKIFDIEEMQRTLVEFEIDTREMPLGKLSRAQLAAALAVLRELHALLSSDASDDHAIAKASNRFYMLVPHSFGLRRAPSIASLAAVARKRDIVLQLMETQLTYSMLHDGVECPSVAECYAKLRSDIVPLSRASPRYHLLQRYLRTTHAPTHHFTLDVEEVFEVTREGESERYDKCRGLHNRRMLWHGSRLTNFAGILSQGLRVAPPEAPATGFMFGKGIYSTDVASKAAQYCNASPTSPYGLLLLCEVALGNMKECLDAVDVRRLPPGVHSVLGVGKHQPDPGCGRWLDDGTLVPLGHLVPTDRLSTLLYNEYVVYNVAQVNLKYLLLVKFTFY